MFIRKEDLTLTTFPHDRTQEVYEVKVTLKLLKTALKEFGRLNKERMESMRNAYKLLSERDRIIFENLKVLKK